jgi:hypothetical protein
MRKVMSDLAQQIPADLPEPIVFLGMAETATALGQGIFTAYLECARRSEVAYLQTSRQKMPVPAF